MNISRKRVNVDDRKILDKASTSTLDISLFDEFHLNVGEFKINHENKFIIQNVFTSTILLNITLVSFNYISKSSKVINIPGYLDFLKQKNLDMNNPLSIDKSNLYEKVMLMIFYDIFQMPFINMTKISWVHMTLPILCFAQGVHQQIYHHWKQYMIVGWIKFIWENYYMTKVIW